jgi:DNA-binding GntR family transcriptional regulator
MPTPSSLATDGLVKKTLAEKLLAEITNGSLSPGERVIEVRWAQHFGVAQGTIREAINLLERFGFVTKEGGRSAREKDAVQLYQMRSAVEGLAANLAAQAQPDLSNLQSIVDGMRRAAKSKSASNMLDWDLKFHLELCSLSGNKFLAEYAQRMLIPFFGFVRLRMISGGRSTSVWDKDLESHQRIVDLLREGDGEVAEHYVKKAMARFAKTAYDNWVAHEKRPSKLVAAPGYRL